MLKFDVQVQLEGVAEARAEWKKAFNTFNQNMNKVMARLLHEAAVNRMSVEEVAKHSGIRVSEIRKKMRNAGLDPRNGKMLLAKQAAEALATNAALLGVHPSEVDLMSPLAYLPAGEELQRKITDASTSGVTELPDSEGWDCQSCGASNFIPAGFARVSGNVLFEDRLYSAIVLRFEGMGEAWTTDESGDTLARAAAQEAVRLVSGNPQ
jgi:hypothetical protein